MEENNETILLLPCPFCGKVPKIRRNSGSWGYVTPTLFIECCDIYKEENLEECDNIRGVYSIATEARETLLARWNTRYQG